MTHAAYLEIIASKEADRRDLFLAAAAVGKTAMANPLLGVHHAQRLFNRPDYDLASAKQGSFALVPLAAMPEALHRDYAATETLIVGVARPLMKLSPQPERVEVGVNGQ